MPNSTADRITARYRIETPLAIEEAALVLAGEQSSGTFVAIPGETAELKQMYAARLEEIKELEPSATPSLPGGRSKKPIEKYRRAEVTISWPMHNIGTNLPTLVSTLQGNLYELTQFTGLKLLDIELPQAFTSAYAGPRFGVQGTRDAVGVQGKPLIGTIIKPSVGLSPHQTAEMVDVLAGAGIDFIKDDELMANPPHSPFADRVKAIMPVINKHAERAGKKVMYTFNVTDEIDAMLRNIDLVKAAGGTGIMVSINSVGLAGVKKLADHAGVPIHGHRNGWGMFTRYPWIGMEFAAYSKLWRLAGIDQLHVNGIDNKFWEDDDSVVRSINVCKAPMHNLKPLLPVVSSGQWGGQAPETWRRTQTVDLLYLAGGGIAAHPAGPAAGVIALRQAWEAAVSGVDINEYARTHSELRQTIEKFGKKS